MFAAITTTATGARSLILVCQALPATLWLPETVASTVDLPADLAVKTYSGSLKAVVAQLWPAQTGFIFALASGAVVRLIAPLLTDKATDPAVVVVDDAGQFAISLCGGHQGGGDRLTQRISQLLAATPVITSAAQQQQLPGIDVLGEPFGWQRGTGNWTGVASAIARGEAIQVIQEAGTTLWQQHLPAHHPFQFGWPEVPTPASKTAVSPQARVWISPIQRRFDVEATMPKVQWHPRVLWVGLGCERGTSQALMERAIADTLRLRHLALAAVAGIATLDLKADETGLLALCQAHHWPLKCFTANELRSVPVPHPSPVVEQAVGTPSVAEAAAIRAAMAIAPPSTSAGDCPVKTAENCLCITKKVIREVGEPGAVTVAVAEANGEYTGRPGQLSLVGTGPGSLDQITPAAKDALSQADAIIGYSLYVDLIRPLLRPGQIVEGWPITQEQQRAERAIALAQWGLTVAVISSGDCGIYAMAGLVLETLQAQGWDGQTPTVTSYPGISALQAAAARVGAPLMHDFCAISLSDLLTPWPVIEKRLAAAAAADFVIALYNPKSQKRTEQIAIAQQLILQHRSAETPAALVRSAYRPDESIIVTTLGDLLDHPIDMLTTVIIGNRSTQLYANQLITPRGYRL
ncbi:precorrin-3B C(17)-methyltransferase [Leptolyngbya iicbica]|uniref:Precorrin-3B C(17)-methyltransferase n=2 Tax=Cyanophyceae TaxID=3028117 RepID=A0A4V2E2J6_9CYAN|nr:precorrin-3B C(17)-methyltransferase [Leptolyngbya sp. LK]RZM78786.1 precorrin-3B C(17)-methyltransferase [Leptolyngbya sp. LK]